MITDARQVGRYESGSGGAWVIEAPADFDIYSAPAVRNLAIQLQEGGATVIVGAHKRLRGAGGEGAAVAAAGSPAASRSPA